MTDVALRSPILAPLVALVLWTFVMSAWLYATRIPAVRRLGVAYDPNKPNEAFIAQMPARVRWKADNYNNLMEQPPIFYAVALVLALQGAGGGLNLWLASAYVAIRVAHSLVHALLNKVMIRFALYAAGSLVLLALALRAALLVF